MVPSLNKIITLKNMEKIEEIKEMIAINEKLTEIVNKLTNMGLINEADKITKFMEDEITKFIEKNWTELTGGILPLYFTNDHLKEIIIKLENHKHQQHIGKQHIEKTRIKKKLEQINTIMGLL